MTRDIAEQRLADLRRQVRAEVRLSQARTRRRSTGTTHGISATTVLLRAGMIAAIVALPFLVYVRASVFFYSRLGGAPWVAVAGALTATVAFVAAYATWLVRRMVGRPGAATVARWVAAPMAAGWLLYSLLFLARVNAKTEGVREYYSSLHPVLRVAVSTAIIVDPGAVITDLQRAPADYGRMGLPVNPTTRHYMQADGWVHAADIRTNGRGEIRNRSLQLYFRAMGFSTLRHVGTSDHLHVQLR